MSATAPRSAGGGRVLPGRLRPGDLIAVVAPGARPEPDALEAGVEHLRERGFRVEVGAHVLDRYGHMAGQDRDRAADLMNAFERPDVRAVFCARGGSGSARTIPYLDLPRIARNPRVFVGYSDVTVLHAAFARHAGWPTFYGPMVATEMDGRDCEGDPCGLWRLVTRAEPAGVLGPDLPPAVTLRGGVAEGVLAGGTLCVLESAIGTAYAPDTRGKLLALEDAEEPPWRVDRMLTHLHHAGLLDAAGFVVGSLSDEPAGASGDLPVADAVRDHVAARGVPAIVDAPFGHIARPLTIPLGCLARLDADAGRLTILEPAVA